MKITFGYAWEKQEAKRVARLEFLRKSFYEAQDRGVEILVSESDEFVHVVLDPKVHRWNGLGWEEVR